MPIKAPHIFFLHAIGYTISTIDSWHKQNKVKRKAISNFYGTDHDYTVLFVMILQARIIFDKAVKVPYKHVDDLASVWCEWAEMEIKHE